MKRRRHSPEQIFGKLDEGQRLSAQGKDLAEVAKYLEVTPASWYCWLNQYGGMKADDAKRRKELERERQRLKKIVADQALEIDMLKELAKGKF